MDDSVRIFLDPGSDDDTVLHAISQMANGSITPSLWTKVANDTSYRPFHRAAAVHELFRRHVSEPVTLRDLALLLDGGRWLIEAVIERIEVMAGEIPVRVPAGGAAFIIRLPQDAAMSSPEAGMYLALDRVIDAGQLREALMSEVTDGSVRQIRVVDITLFPDRLGSTDTW